MTPATQPAGRAEALTERVTEADPILAVTIRTAEEIPAALVMAVAEVMAEEVAVATSAQATKAIIFDFFGVIRTELPSGVGNDPGLLNFIEALRRTYKIGLLSNIGLERLDALLPREVQARCFDAVATSGEIGHAKPEPDAYKTIASWLGVPPEDCLMVDDLASHCVGARAVGMQAIQYDSLAGFKQELGQLLSQSTN